LLDVVGNLRLQRPVNQSRSQVLDAMIQRGIFHGVVMNTSATRISLDDPLEAERGLFGSMFKFVFVRHPFERLVSAYYDKFVRRRDPDFIDAMIYHETPADVMLKASINKFMFRKETRMNFRINFEKFVRFVVYEIKNRVVSYGSYHWMPYTDFCGLCAIKYNFIGKLETLEGDVELLSKHFGEKVDLNLIRNIFQSKRNSSPGRSTRTSHHVFSKLPKSLIKELYEVYQPDFTIGNYPYPTKYIELGKND
jgi:hypothetical protein